MTGIDSLEGKKGGIPIRNVIAYRLLKIRSPGSHRGVQEEEVIHQHLKRERLAPQPKKNGREENKGK